MSGVRNNEIHIMSIEFSKGLDYGLTEKIKPVTVFRGNRHRPRLITESQNLFVID